jgi:hypothetical protein
MLDDGRVMTNPQCDMVGGGFLAPIIHECGWVTGKFKAAIRVANLEYWTRD